MNERDAQGRTFPVGFHQLHRDKLFNFTLNRWHSIGYARLEDLREAAARIHRYADWKPELLRIADAALAEGRLINAAIYYRSAEFFTDPSDPDRARLYDLFAEHFYAAFADEELERCAVPYEGSSLPAIRLRPSGENRGTIVLHGGMDSFVEEWFLMMKQLARQGYEVIGFDGPGQGAALIKGGLAMDIRWERPVGAVLDHFELDDVTLIGLSVGGWLALRAAAFEPRISRVISSGHAIHYMDIPPAPIAWIFEFFTRFESLFNKSALMKMEKNPRMKWEIGQTMHITRSSTPLEGARKFNLALSRENMHADRIGQDVLIMSGHDDHFIPIRLHQQQVEALVNARSVSERVFTADESAQSHCQIGNIGLALEEMREWIAHKTEVRGAGRAAQRHAEEAA